MSRLAELLDDDRPDPAPCGSPPWRRAARATALSALAACESLRPRPRKASVQFLLLHHVRVDEEAAFRRLLRRLSANYRLIDYDAAARRVTTGEGDHPTVDARPQLAVSFDDGLACNRRAAAVLEEFGVRGAFFVCPPVHAEADRGVLDRFCRQRLRHAPAEFLRWDGVEALHAAGHTIGGHTLSHVDLGDVSHGRAVDEINGCREDLLARLGTADHFAWPYGSLRHVTDAAVSAVFDAGFATCASGVRGAHAVDRSAEPPSDAAVVLRRQSIEAGWPVSHVQTFLRLAARRPLQSDASSVRRPESPESGDHHRDAA